MMKTIFTLCAGLILFLFAMVQLSEAVQRLFTFRIRKYIQYIVQRPFSGLMTGFITTLFFQSSSATTVLTVGMVSAGLISFYHSLAILLGADVGTVITVQLVVWKITDFSPIFIVIGGSLWFMKDPRWKSPGEIIFYFGLLFFGLGLTAGATAPLKDSPFFLSFFQEATPPLLGFAIGLFFTALVHASVIPISILVILAQQDIISLHTALPIVFGANVGTTITALMASLISGINGKRTAVSHALFKLTGGVILMIFLPLTITFLQSLAYGNIPQQIVLGHLLLNLLIAVIFFFVLKPFARMVEWLVPGKEETLPVTPEYLDEKLLIDPPVALECTRKELERQFTMGIKMFHETVDLRLRYDQGRDRNVGYFELVVDHLRRQITSYLRKLSHYPLTKEQRQRLFTYTYMTDDMERIGDHVTNMLELIREMHFAKISFSADANQELQEIEALIADNLTMTHVLLEHGGDHMRVDDSLILKITEQEEQIDAKTKLAEENHLVRFHNRICSDNAGPVFVEYLTQLERVADHCQNIAVYTKER
ncbi:MAG: Na/Pi cotransporter family protein [Syntrophobacterales bacterium]|jgi:phosphate:Na+ symporter|nr:Na/Pi cotransporter family protein [Syntrophobacterales bacterium]